jgi:hypothetical protein
MGKKQKVHSLTGRIDDRLMKQAFKAVKRNRGAAGIDKVSIVMFEENLDANLASLKRDLKTRGSFVPKPLRRVWIPKDTKGKKLRPLGIPAVRDRIAQEVIRGMANCFATDFSTCIKLYQQLDKWIRMRVRCMKFKRKLTSDNSRLRIGTFRRKLGLLRMLDFTTTTMGKS